MSPKKEQELNTLLDLLCLPPSDKIAILQQGIRTVSTLVKTTVSALERLFENRLISLGAYNELQSLLVYKRLNDATTDQLLAIDPEDWECLVLEEMLYLLALKESTGSGSSRVERIRRTSPSVSQNASIPVVRGCENENGDDTVDDPEGTSNSTARPNVPSPVKGGLAP